MSSPIFILPAVGLVLSDDQIPAPPESTVTPFVRADGSFAVKLPDGSVKEAGGASGGGAVLPPGMQGAVLYLEAGSAPTWTQAPEVGMYLGSEDENGTRPPYPMWKPLDANALALLVQGLPLNGLLYRGGDGAISIVDAGTVGQVLMLVADADGVLAPKWVTATAGASGGTGGSGGTGTGTGTGDGTGTGTGGSGGTGTGTGGSGGTGTGTGGAVLTGTPISAQPYSADYDASKAFDGDLTTVFAGASPGGCFIGLDCGSAKTLQSVRLYPRAGYPAQLQGASIETSADGVTWAATGQSLTGSIVEGQWYSYVLPSVVTARCFRLVGVSPNSTASVAEVQFLGS